jgi:PPOX class probable F420-dependent enzyme
MQLTDEQLAFIQRQRVGRLATADAAGQPHAVPVVYACDGQAFYIVLDAKPKQVDVLQLKRVRNIRANPQVALVIDRYAEDWRMLAYVLIRGTAEIVLPGVAEQQRAIALLRDRYEQYRTMAIEAQPVIAIRPANVAAWGALTM